MTPLLALDLRCDQLPDPLGLPSSSPVFGWALSGTGHDRRQTAFRVMIASTLEVLHGGQGDLWDSGRVQSDQQRVPYGGPALGSRQRGHWRVMVWDETGESGPWSPAASLEVALLEQRDWQADWIEYDAGHREDTPGPCPMLRTSFQLPAPTLRARLYVSALGVYEARLNGRRIGDALLAPGWTDYHTRVLYQTYDVTTYLHGGENVLGAVLGDGWYCGRIGFRGERRHYGPRPRFIAQLEIECQGGQRVTVISGPHWKGTTGPIRSSDFLMGETYDARLEQPGWDRAGFGTAHWDDVSTVRWHAPLVADPGPVVRALMTLTPVGEQHKESSARIYDLGQNIVGWVRVRVVGDAGSSLTVRFAEMLTPEGHLYTEALRSARASDTYICTGAGEEVFEPHFTFHGFRYVEVNGDAQVLEVEGVVIGSDLPEVGTFECSDPDLNQLQSNIIWGQRGNFLSVPTDCPQRDERLGWLGDAQVFAHTAALNADVSAFFSKWMQDVEDAQSPAGGFPDVAPRVVVSQDGAPGWGNAGVILPWELYRHYGDCALIARHWTAMTRWMEFLEEANPNGLWLHRRGNDFGDWLAQDGDNPADAFGSRTPKEVVATAFWAQDAQLMSRMATVLGKPDASERYARLYDKICAAFVAAFLEPDGWVRGRTQTGQTLALAFDLLPQETRLATVSRLVELIDQRDGHLTTGFLGVRHLLPVLTRFGRSDMAHHLLRQETFPSWLYSIRQGATTIWERWDGYTHEHGFQDPSMNSFNHYSLGSVGQWMYESLAGLGLGEERPSFGHVVIAPHPGQLSWARAEHASVRGLISVAWRTDGTTFHLDVILPPNMIGTVYSPDGFQPLSTGQETGLYIGSGHHTFTVHRQAHALHLSTHNPKTAVSDSITEQETRS